MKIKERILSFWRKLTNRYIAVGEGTYALKVMNINSSDNSLTESLGITSERSDVLAKEVITAYKTSKDLVSAISKASDIAVHANELFYMIWVMADYHKNRRSPMNGLFEALLSSISRSEDK